ncbi:MAG: TolC family protein [Candidatus Binatia bacterium]|nr:TolC family protein [Candidatus Binatia bacterium]
MMALRRLYIIVRFPLMIAVPLLLGGASMSRAAEPAEEGGPLRLSLTDCIRRAMEYHPAVQEVRWDVEIRRSDVQQAEAGYYPTGEFVNITGVVNDAKGNILRFRQGGIGDLGPFTRIEGQIAYPLFTWGKLPNGLKAAQKGLEQELVSVEQRKAEAIREVKELYYTLLYTRQVQELMNDVRSGFEKAVAVAEERLREDKITQLDLLNLRIGYASVAKEEARLRNGIELTRSALLRAMGLPQTTQFEIADKTLTPQPAHLKELDYYVERLFANRPEWRKLRLGLQAREAELRVATSDYFPTVFFAIPFRYAYAPDRSRQTNPFAYDNFNFGGGGPVVGVRWSLGFAETAAKVARSRAELMKLRAQEKTAVMSFPLEVKEAYLNVKEAEERIRVTADGRRAGRTLVTLAVANFELGIGEPQEVFLSLGNYTRATNDYYEAVRDYNVALAKLSLVVGEEVSELQY